jgi:hypothetical protein
LYLKKKVWGVEKPHRKFHPATLSYQGHIPTFSYQGHIPTFSYQGHAPVISYSFFKSL